MIASTIPPITALPQNLPLDSAIAPQDNVMIFRASRNIQQRIENLLDDEVYIKRVGDTTLQFYLQTRILRSLCVDRIF